MTGATSGYLSGASLKYFVDIDFGDNFENNNISDDFKESSDSSHYEKGNQDCEENEKNQLS